jgi:CheY-like chemotaxis protein
VVLATGQTPIVDATVSALEAWGLQALAISQGAEAMLAIQRTLPRVVVLDTALPGMDGLQICEVIKRNESLRKIRVILIADSPDSQFVADLGEFGPDAHRARANLLDDLHELMSEFGLPMSVGRTPSPPPAALAEKPTASPADGLDQDRAKAERLARIVVSDIVLYQGEAFDRANLSGTLVEDFAVDLAEGRQLLSDRVDGRVCKERDHLVEELMRVAEERRKD